MKIKKLINKKVTKLTKQLTKWYRKTFSKEFGVEKLIPNYVTQLTIHPWSKPLINRHCKSLEVVLGFITLSFANSFGAGVEPMLDNRLLFESARILSKSIGVPNSFALVIGTSPMVIKLFSFDYHRVKHYLPESLVKMMAETVSELAVSTPRQAILKSKKVKKGKK